MTQYAQQGFTADLPDLITGRWDHACAGYNDDQDHFVLLVVGGRSDDDFDGYIDSLSSTEIYKVGVSFQWTEVSALPYELYGVRASTVTKRIYLTGEDRGQDAPIILIFWCSRRSWGGLHRSQWNIHVWQWLLGARVSHDITEISSCRFYHHPWPGATGKLQL